MEPLTEFCLMVGQFHPDSFEAFFTLQRSSLFCANTVKKDPGRARQNSLATAGTNFTKPGALSKVEP